MQHVSVSRALLDQSQPRAAARELMADLGWDIYACGLKLASLPARLTTRDPGARLRRTIGPMMRFPFIPGGAGGYRVESWSAGDRIYTHWTRCPPHEAVRRIVATHGDRGDLEAFSRSWCRYDWPGADLIAGDGLSGHYRRTCTLSRGDAVCDMCWSGSPVEPGATADTEASRVRSER